jgi:hypothetical protein
MPDEQTLFMQNKTKRRAEKEGMNRRKVFISDIEGSPKQSGQSNFTEIGELKKTRSIHMEVLLAIP